MKKMNYKTLCEKLNVTDNDIKARMKADVNTTEEKYGFDWIRNAVNPGCKLTTNEIGQIWKSLNWVKSYQNPKYSELRNIAAMLFCYRVEELNYPINK